MVRQQLLQVRQQGKDKQEKCFLLPDCRCTI